MDFHINHESYGLASLSPIDSYAHAIITIIAKEKYKQKHQRRRV